MKWVRSEGPQRYREVVAAAGGALIGLDFDGTLAPIVEDPPQAWIHPAMPDLLLQLGEVVGTVAIVTGRPAAQAVELARLEEIASPLANLIVLGQYGNESWSSSDQRVHSQAPPDGLAGFIDTLPELFESLGFEPRVEDKGLAVAIHTRSLPDPTSAYQRLIAPLSELAARHGLVIEPGRFVLEARAAGMDKGIALRRLAEATQPSAMLFAGDDLGDIPAFQELGRQREAGLPTLQVCSGSPEQPLIAAETDVILDGPDGVAAFFEQFLADIRSE